MAQRIDPRTAVAVSETVSQTSVVALDRGDNKTMEMTDTVRQINTDREEIQTNITTPLGTVKTSDRMSDR